MPKFQHRRPNPEASPVPQRAKPAEAAPTRSGSLRHLAPDAIVQRAMAAPHSLRPAELISMQQTLGNRATGAMLGRAPTHHTHNTGLPDDLKTGIELLSGMPMDNVEVHYNSSQPARLSALAYTQGTDIHVAPGQEQHLPHEAWHVVQQLQGRVRPTMQIKEGVPVNDDGGLELEAEVMGTKAAQMRRPDAAATGAGVETAMAAQKIAERGEASTVRGETLGSSGEEVHLNFPSLQPNNSVPVMQQMHGTPVVQRKLNFDRGRLEKAEIGTNINSVAGERYRDVMKALDKYNKYYAKYSEDVPMQLRYLAGIEFQCKEFVEWEPSRRLQLEVVEDLLAEARRESGLVQARAVYMQGLHEAYHRAKDEEAKKKATEEKVEALWEQVSTQTEDKDIPVVENLKESKRLYYLSEKAVNEAISAAWKETQSQSSKKYRLDVADIAAIKYSRHPTINTSILLPYATPFGWVSKKKMYASTSHWRRAKNSKTLVLCTKRGACTPP
jgi:hypothetical protein